jgi:POLQ-like helicase
MLVHSVGIGLLPEGFDPHDLWEPTATPPKRHQSEPFYDLPFIVGQLYRSRGVTQLYKWQDEVVSHPVVRGHGSFVYSMPTSGGKTLVAEIISFRTVLSRQRSALFVLPYVAIAEEKTTGMRAFSEACGFGLEGHYGTTGRLPPPSKPTVFVCTIEKANSLLNAFFECNRHHEIGSIVVDEIHMLGDGRRGATLEMLLTKAKRIPAVQIIGMSATVPNLPDIARWLNAECYLGNFRPVELVTHTVCEGRVTRLDSTECRMLDSRTDAQVVCELVAECVPQASVLVFCATRSQTVETARLIGDFLKRVAKHPLSQARKDIASELKSMETNESSLAHLMKLGVGYHHGGLLAEERVLVETAFSKKAVWVVCCTSTLAAGVNLPARRVVIRSPYVGRDFLARSMYRQMCGRAGRAGLDVRGESFLIYQTRDRTRVKVLSEEPPEVIASKLFEAHEDVAARAIQEIVAFESQVRKSAAEDFVMSTFWACHNGPQVPEVTQRILKSLVEKGCIHEQEPGAFVATQLGNASMRAFFTAKEAAFVTQDLLRVQKVGLVLEDDLHICYLLTPIQDSPEPRWDIFERIVNSLDPARQRIAQLIGLDEVLISHLASGMPARSMSDNHLFIARRFYGAMILNDVLRELHVADIEVRFGINRGQVQALMKAASIFSASIATFCASMDWFALEAVLVAYVKRLGYGVRPDLIPLMDIPGVTAPRARALWNAGFKTPASIAAVSPELLKETVRAANPESQSVKYFSVRSAAATIREANSLIRKLLQNKAQELHDLASLSPATLPA